MSIKIQVKHGRRILKTDEKVKINGLFITVQTIIDLFDEIEKAFFSDFNVTLIFQTSWKGANNNYRYAGMAHMHKQTANVWTYDVFKGNHKLDYWLTVGAHELGHLYHKHSDRTDYWLCTPYGKEVYANSFARLVCDNMLNEQWLSDESKYVGYPNNVHMQDYEGKVIGL